MWEILVAGVHVCVCTCVEFFKQHRQNNCLHGRPVSGEGGEEGEESDEDDVGSGASQDGGLEEEEEGDEPEANGEVCLSLSFSLFVSF